MHEKIRPLDIKPLEKATRPDLLSLKALELTHRPCQKRQIDLSQQRTQRRWRVSPVVRNPTPKQRIELLGNVDQRQLRSMSKVQLPNRRPHGLQRRDADRGIEAAEQHVVPAPPHQTGPKAVAEEIKLNVRIRSFTFTVLAVDDLGFGRMQLQAARCQASVKFGLEGYRFV